MALETPTFDSDITFLTLGPDFIADFDDNSLGAPALSDASKALSAATRKIDDDDDLEDDEEDDEDEEDEEDDVEEDEDDDEDEDEDEYDDEDEDEEDEEDDDVDELQVGRRR
jgi:hypothetical protein